MIGALQKQKEKQKDEISVGKEFCLTIITMVGTTDGTTMVIIIGITTVITIGTTIGTTTITFALTVEDGNN
jgi:hypothetical protein